MDKDTITLMLSAAQIEALLIVILTLCFKWIGRFWFIRILLGLLVLLALTVSIVFFIMYSNGLVNTSPSHPKNILPPWLISLSLGFVGYLRIKHIAQHRNNSIFYQSKSYRLYLYQTIAACILFSLAPLASYVSTLHPYRKSILLITSFFFLSNIFLEYFVISKKQIIENKSLKDRQ